MAKNMTAGKPKKTKINFVDILILAVIAVAAVALYFIFFAGNVGNAENVQPAAEESFKMRYIVEVKLLDENLANNIAVGDKVTDSVELYPLGEVVAVERQPGYVQQYDIIDGSIVYAEYPEHSNLYITIESNAKMDGYRYSVNGFKLSVGTTMYLRTPNLTLSGYCIGFEIVD